MNGISEGVILAPSLTASAARPASRSALVGWVLFDWAAQPFFTLIITFVYAPFFASAIRVKRAPCAAGYGRSTPEASTATVGASAASAPR